MCLILYSALMRPVAGDFIALHTIVPVLGVLLHGREVSLHCFCAKFMLDKNELILHSKQL